MLAAPLRLTHDDLMQRYRLEAADIRLICEQMPQRVTIPEEVFQAMNVGFRALLRYWIYVCTPAAIPTPDPGP